MIANTYDDAAVPVVSRSDYASLRDLPLNEELADELDRAIVVHSERLPPDAVSMHARCTYHDEHTDALRDIELVYPHEAEPALGKISVLTPVGSALLGLRVGQAIEWPFPDGSVHCLRVKRVVQPGR